MQYFEVEYPLQAYSRSGGCKSVWELLKCNHSQRQLRESSSTLTAFCSYSYDSMIGAQLSSVWVHII